MPAKNRKKRSFGSKIFSEIKWEVMKVHILLQMLNAAILFFTLNILLTLFNMSYLYSAGVATLFFIWRLTRGWKTSTLRKLEEGNPEVHELLRTAYEHKDHESLMVQGLIYELQRKLSTVSAGVLIKPKDLMMKLVAIALLAFVPIAIISFTPFLIQENPLRGVTVQGIISEGTGGAFDDVFGTQLNRSDDIYGEADVLELGDERLQVEVVSGGGSVDFNQVSDPEDKTFRYNDYPQDVQAEASEASTGNQFSDEDVALINEYSCQQRGTC